MSTLANPLSLLKLVQCYHCHELVDHTKDQCPLKDVPQPYSKCGELGHSFGECLKPANCKSCSGAHPITARCCPAYKAKFSSQMLLVFHQLYRDHGFMDTYRQWKSEHSPQEDPEPHHNSSNLSDATWAATQDAASRAENPTDFMNILYTLVKATTLSSSPCSTVASQLASDSEFDTDESPVKAHYDSLMEDQLPRSLRIRP